MKKLTALLLCVIMIFSVFSLLSCDKEVKKSEAYLAYDAALKKMEKLDSMEIGMSIGLTVEPGPSSSLTNATMIYNIKAINNDINPLMRMTCKIASSGFDTDMDVYIEDGWGYFSIDAEVADQKVKQQYKMKLEDGDMTDGLVDSTAVEYSPKMLADAILKDEGNGKKSIELAPSEKEMNDLYKGLIESTLSSVVGNGELKIEKAKMKIIIGENGYFDSMNMDIEITVGGVSMSMVYNVDYIDPGKKVTVVPMSGYESFSELDLGI